MKKAKLIEVFSAYAKNYDFDDPMIALKYNHSLSVANLCYEIASSLMMSEEEKLLSYFIGLVHEIGSFENWKKTKTYQDVNTTKQILFNEKLITKFGADKSDEKIAMLTIDGLNKNNEDQIKNYCKKFKESEKKFEQIITHKNILKDANILDLFGMIKRKSLPVVHAKTTKQTLSKAILKQFKEEDKVNADNVQSKLDQVVYFLSLYFDLKYTHSILQAQKIDFAQAIYDYFAVELADKEKERMLQIIKTLKQKTYK